MPRRHAVLALVVAVCWAVNFVVIDIGLESFPPLLFAALRFGLIAFPAIFFVPRPDVRWPAVIGVGLFSDSYTLRKYRAGGADLAPPGRTCYADADVPIDGYLPRPVDQVSVPVRG